MDFVIGVLLLLAQAASRVHCLQLHFYQDSCPRAEAVVQQVVLTHFRRDPSVSAGLLRLHFHDCFVRGCDASVLVDSTDYNIAEKEAPPNLTLRGFEVIDAVKAALEEACPGVVSCADALALAARDGVALAGGPAYDVPTGRRDGTVSLMSDVHIPSPQFSVQQALEAFQKVNLDLFDLTTLLGAHSIGRVHCGFFIDRLYDYKGSGQPDPRMDAALLSSLQRKCPPHLVTITNITQDVTLDMNQAAPVPAPPRFGSSFYLNVLDGRAVLQLDQDLAFTDLTAKIAAQYANEPELFGRRFAAALVKLGSAGVLTGRQGEVRRNCRVVNSGGQRD